MKRKIKFDPAQNPEKNFIIVKKDILSVASSKGIPVTQVIDDFISDILNFNNADYEKKVDDINISGAVSNNLLNSLTKYVIKMRKQYKDIENKEKKQEKSNEMESNWKQIEDAIDKAAIEGKQGTKKEIVERLIADINNGNFEYDFKSKEKKFVLKNLKGIVDEINKKEEIEAEEKRRQEQEAKEAEERRRQEQEAKEAEERRRQEQEAKEKRKKEEIDRKEAEKRNADKAMEKIQEIVEREFNAGNIKNKANYLASIKGAIMGKTKGAELDIKLEGIEEKNLLKMIDVAIKREKDEIYFEQVKSFTNNFQFLREYSEIVRARHGARKERFTDKESYERFTALRLALQKQGNEYEGIATLLKNKSLNEGNRRILIARKEIMDREIERKRKDEGIR